MAQITVTSTKDGAKHTNEGLVIMCWILCYAVRIPVGTEGVGPNGRYNVTVIEVPA